MSIEVRYVLEPGAVAPKRYSAGAACFDLVLPEDVFVFPHTTTVANFKIKFEPKDNCHFMMIYPRSSLLVKYGIIMPTSIIDADYRGPIHAIMYNTTPECIRLRAGMRIAQVNMAEWIATKFEQVEQLHTSERGERGIGSTGE
jgi:dUTP pyrophosphatase